MRLINAEKLEEALETGITTMKECAKAIDMEDDKGIQMALISHEDILDKIKKEETIEAIPIKHLKRIAHDLRYSDDIAERCVGCGVYGIICQWEEGEWEEEQE